MLAGPTRMMISVGLRDPFPSERSAARQKSMMAVRKKLIMRDCFGVRPARQPRHLPGDDAKFATLWE
jgi:hypothetical protein